MKLLKHIFPTTLCATLLCSLLVVPSHAVTGTVVNIQGNPVAGATVTCEVKEDNVWRVWASESWKMGEDGVDPDSLKSGAEDYGQSPTMLSGETGRCGWMLPPGTYRFKATSEDGNTVTSQEFTVGNPATQGNVDNTYDLGQLKLKTQSGNTSGEGGSSRPSGGYSPWLGGSGSSDTSRPETAELMTLNLTAGTVVKGSKLTLTPTDKATNVTFVYTTDGSAPTINSKKYAEPIVIDKDMTIKIAAVQNSTLGTVETYTFTAVDARLGSLKSDAASTRYLSGYSDSLFRPNQAATRYEVAEALTYLLVLGDGSNAAAFSDLSEQHRSAVSRLAEAGIINGFKDGTFQGDGNITRAQMCKILCIILDYQADPASAAAFSDVPAKHWALGYIGALSQAGHLKGYTDGTFRPDQAVTRAELAALLNRVAGRKDVSGQAPEYSDVSAKFWGYEDIKNASIPITTASEQ